MTPEALDLTAELAAQLDASEREHMTDELRAELTDGDRRDFAVDTRTIPARFSHLKAIAQSPAHALAALRDRREIDSLALRLGTAVHALTFGTKQVVRYEGKRDKRVKKYLAFLDEHPDAEVLSPGEWTKAQAISAELLRHDVAAPLLFGAGVVREQTILWEQCGRKRRTTPDVHKPKEYVVELKSTRCAEPGRFVRDAMYRAYHAQLADQCAAIEASTGVRPERAFIVAVETVHPYVVQVFQLMPRALEKGAMLCRQWLDRLLLAETVGEWPPYSTGVEPFDVWEEDVALEFGEDDGARASVEF